MVRHRWLSRTWQVEAWLLSSECGERGSPPSRQLGSAQEKLQICAFQILKAPAKPSKRPPRFRALGTGGQLDSHIESFFVMNQLIEGPF